MPDWAKRMLVTFAAFTAGTTPAFFLGGPAFFADGPYAERWGVLALYAGIILLLGLALGALWPDRAQIVGNALAVPILPVAVLLTEWDKPEMAVLSAAFTVAAFVAGLAGAVVGAYLRRRIRGTNA